MLQTLGVGTVAASSGVPTIINYRYDNANLPSSLQWNAGVQMTLPWSSSLDVAYVGQHSYDVLNAFNGANVNLTGSPDYAARVVITGDPGSGCGDDRFKQFNTAAFSGPRPGSLGLESGRNYMIGCPNSTTDLAIARTFNVGGARTVQFRVEMYNAFNVVVYNARQTQLQLVSPSNQTIRNSQFLPDGSVDPNRLKTTSAGFGAVTGAQPLRTIQAQVRFSF